MNRESEQLTSAVTMAGASIATTPALRLAGTKVLAGGALPLNQRRIARPDEIASVLAQIGAHGEELEAELRRRSGPPLERAMLNIKSISTFAAKTQFNNEQAMSRLSHSIAKALETQQPIRFVLPLGGTKVPNALKTGEAFLPDVGELIGVTRLASLARVISATTGVDARVIILPDAPLHAADLGIPTVEVQKHIEVARNDIRRLGIADWVEIVNTADVLPDQFPEEVVRRTKAAQERVRSDAGFALDVASQVGSLLFSINTRQYGWSLEHQVLVTLALAGDTWLPSEVRSDATAIRREVEGKVLTYVGVNHAIRSAAVPEHVVRTLHGDSAMVRLTVHAKPGEPQPQLVQDSLLARPGLLPMHSVGVRFSTEEGDWRIATAFALETMLETQTAVLESQGGRILWYQAELAAAAQAEARAA